MVIKFIAGSIVPIHQKGHFGGPCMVIKFLSGSVMSIHPKAHS